MKHGLNAESLLFIRLMFTVVWPAVIVLVAFVNYRLQTRAAPFYAVKRPLPFYAGWFLEAVTGPLMMLTPAGLNPVGAAVFIAGFLCVIASGSKARVSFGDIRDAFRR